jgi:hypothetical protein
MMFDKILLQPWADELLKTKNVDKYLVSSGPNYYIDILAEKYKIPDEHICRSFYRFSKDTGLIESCDSADGQLKAFFVNDKVKSYDLTIGIGDNAEHDGPFVSKCSIGLLTVSSDSFIHIPNFSAVIRLIHNLEAIGDSSGRQDESLHVDKLSIPQLIRRLSIHSWIILISVIAFAFGLGAATAKWFQ